MAYTNPQDVRTILALEDATIDLTLFIADANMVVADFLEGKGYSSQRLEAIERFLAAHFYLLSSENGGVIRAKIGESEESYVGANSRAGANAGFKFTRWGQQALALDHLGILNSLSETLEGKKKALIRSV